MPGVTIGTCSWNYHSWVGLIYSQQSPVSAGYLKEYAKKYRTAEIDSWFYKIPDPREVDNYLAQVDDSFTFSCKITRDITLTHIRQSSSVNPNFLSTEFFNRYIGSLQSMLPRITTLVLEFEYLNRDKMPSLTQFLDHLDRFFNTIDRSLPVAIETRNKNYITKEYFQFLHERNIGHVFSEKIYMPHIYDIYQSYGNLLTDYVTIRLLGGDRNAIEEKTGGEWHTVVEPKEDLPLIAEMINDLSMTGKTVHVYVNNHYEGCAPKTIEKLEQLLANKTVT
jgi:uncharacterized protein YecE (DUF72 family)